MGGKGSGGAVQVHSRVMAQEKDNNNTKRVTTSSVWIENCDFDNCKTSGEGGAIDFTVQVNSITIKGTHFSGCTAGGSSGGVSFAAAGMKDETSNVDYRLTYATFGTRNEEEQFFNDKGYTYTTIGSIVIGPLEITKFDGTTSVRNTRFDNCGSDNYGGGISFATHMKTNKVEMNGVIIKGCTAKNGGTALYMGNTIIKEFNLTSCQFKQCVVRDLAGNDTGTDVGGTFRTIGNTTAVAYVKDCVFSDNISKMGPLDHNGGPHYFGSFELCNSWWRHFHSCQCY